MKFLAALFGLLIACNCVANVSVRTDDDSADVQGTFRTELLQVTGTGAGAQSYFAGHVGIGGTTAPIIGTANWIDEVMGTTGTSALMIDETEANRTAPDSALLLLNNSATFDTTAGDIQSIGMRITHDPSNATPGSGNDLICRGLVIDTNNCDQNQAINITHGDAVFEERVLAGPTEIDGTFTGTALTVTNGLVNITATSGVNSITLPGATSNVIIGGQGQFGDQITTGANVRLAGNTLWFTDNTDTNLFIYADSAGTSGNQTMQIMAGGTGSVDINSNVDATPSAGTGGLRVFAGGGSAVIPHRLRANAHVATDGTDPALSSCGTGTIDANSSDRAGIFTTGAITTCTLTFATTYTNKPSCSVWPEGIATVPTCTISATAITCSVVATTTPYHYQCTSLGSTGT